MKEDSALLLSVGKLFVVCNNDDTDIELCRPKLKRLATLLFTNSSTMVTRAGKFK